MACSPDALELLSTLDSDERREVEGLCARMAWRYDGTARPWDLRLVETAIGIVRAWRCYDLPVPTYVPGEV